MKWRILLLMLSVVLLAALLCLTVAAKEGGSVTYETQDGTAVVTGGKPDKDGLLSIPSELDGLPVTALAPHAFEKNKDIQSVRIPGSVKTVGKYCFCDCSRLYRLETEPGVEVFETEAFSRCSLMNVSLGVGLKRIGADAFNVLKAKELHLPDGLEVMERQCISSDTLKKLYVPASIQQCENALSLEGSNVTVYGYRDTPIFDCCINSVTFVDIPSGTVYQRVYSYRQDNILYNVYWDHAEILQYVNNSAVKDLVIPETVEGKPVTRLGYLAFPRCSFQSVYIPDSVTRIDSYAFEGCRSLCSVHMSENLQSAGYAAFSDCDQLCVLYLPRSFVSGGDYYGENKEKTILNSNTKTILVGYPDSYAEGYAKRCGFSFIPLADDGKYVLMANAVYYSEDGQTLKLVKLTRSAKDSGALIIPDEVNGMPVTAIGATVFLFSNVHTLVIGENVTSIDDYAFRNTHITCCYFPAGVTELGSNLFVVSDPPTIYGLSGTAIEDYAREHGIPFVDRNKVPFRDVSEKAWYFEAVRSAYWNGYMAGTAETSFSPKMTTSRAMLAKILSNMAGGYFSYSEKSYFDDVPQGSWYYEAANYCRKQGIVYGTSERCFSPNIPVTREQAATLFYRYANKCGLDIDEQAPLDGFTDAVEVSDFAQSALRWAVAEQILFGKSDGRLDPKGSATRAEIAAILTRFAQFANAS